MFSSECRIWNSVDIFVGGGHFTIVADSITFLGLGQSGRLPA
jgi:hypothetical protein